MNALARHRPSYEELAAENVVLRRQLVMDVSRQQAARLREALGVTLQFALILLALYQADGVIVGYPALTTVLEANGYGDRQNPVGTVRMAIHKLRKVMGSDAIENVPGVGYRLGADMRGLVGAALAETARAGS